MAERLPISDAGWLLIEGRETPMHVAGLQLFTPPKDAPSDYVGQLFESIKRTAEGEGASTVQPPFNFRLDKPYGRAGLFAWTPDEDIDLEYHVRHAALPAPGRIRELLALVSRLHSTLLDRHRPLWEMYLIEGLNDGRIAVYTKFHHSMFDGVGAMRQAVRSYSANPKERDRPAPWAIPIEEREREASDASPFSTLSKAVTAPVGQAGAFLGATRALAGQVISKARGRIDEVAPFQAPNSILNGRITGSRRFAGQSYSLTRMKTIAKTHGATLNDVVMTACSTALRTYLDELGELPDKPLIAMVPVSIRDDESERGNALSFILADLATDEPHALLRLERIKASMQSGKDRMAGMSRQERVDYGILLSAPTILSNLTGTAGKGRPVYNIVISNVPGPRETLYWNGARMDGMYPVSLLPDGQAMNITLASYVDEIAFGVTACRKTLPSVQRILGHFEAGLDELESMAQTAG